MDIGTFIHNRRLELGLTLEEVGNAVGVKKPTVMRWEKGIIRNMRRDKIKALSSVLDVSPSCFIDAAYPDDETIPSNDSDVRSFLSSRLHDLRLSVGMTAKDVGERIGKSEKTVSGWEHGRGQPDADSLFLLCQIYQVSCDSLLGLDLCSVPLSSFEDQLKEFILSRYGSVRKFTIQHNIPYSTIATIFKRGVENSSITSIFRICDALNISVDELTEGRIVPRNPSTFAQDESALLASYRALNPDGKKAVQDFVRLVTGNPAMLK